MFRRKLLLLVTLSVSSFYAQSQETSSQQAAVNAVIKSNQASLNTQSADRVSQAVGCSKSLLSDLSSMIQTGALKEINISATPSGSFQGYTTNQSVLLTEQLMSVLSEAKHSVYQSDQQVSVNQAAFVLSYLAYRLRTADSVSMSNFANPFAFSQANMRNISTAFLTGWNSMVECATNRNAEKTLTVGQVGELLFRARYKSALMLPRNHRLASKFFTESGKINLSQENIDAVAEVLSNSRVADIK